MTYATALRHAGIEVTGEGVVYRDDIKGKTRSGKTFWMYGAGGAYGTKFTIRIDGEVKATACVFRTAIRIIKSN